MAVVGVISGVVLLCPLKLGCGLLGESISLTNSEMFDLDNFVSDI